MKKLTLLFSILLFSTITWAQGIAGTWNGELNLGTVKLPLVFHIGDNDCTLDSPNQGAKGIKGTVRHLSADSINVDFETLGGSYVAKLVNGKLNGIFSQMGYKLKLEMEKGDLVRIRPQTPQAPFPYQIEEVVFSNVKDTASLAGTLTYPVGYRTGKKVPVVLMITGSGMQNRDEELFEHKPFAVIADYLARHGIASLRYDDRQVGGSTGNISHATSEDFKRDATEGVKFLRSLKRFNKVGIIGHSEGGMIAFMLAQDKVPDFIVTLAGTGIQGDSILTEQTNFILRQQGKPANMTVKQMHLTMLMMKTSPWYEFFVSYDPKEAIQHVTCPAFVLNGSKDSQVIAESNLSAIRKYLPSHKKNKIKEYPGLNHLFQPCKTGAVDEYGTIEQTISEEVLVDIVDWIGTL